MSILNRLTRLQILALLILSLFVGKPASAEMPEFGADGWYTWRVPAAADAPNWCCYSWNSGVAREKICDLDGGHRGFSSSDSDKGMGDELQIYALVDRGKITEIRPLSAQCPVVSTSTIVDIGPVDASNSIDRLQPFIGKDEDLSTEALAAIAAHAGDESLQILLDATGSKHDMELRENAVFWLAQIRGPEARKEIEALMFKDRDPEFREQVAFAYSQSNIRNRSTALIRLGNEDSNADVRSQAWFWLAQTEAEESEAAIAHAISHDKSSDVREEAVFALSQLPDERATKALAAILEDRSLDKDIRQQALFWLAQSDSDTAFTYVEKLFN
jgi:hypothetical protein